MTSHHAPRYRWLRHQSQLSQEKFAERLSVSRSHVARCELGESEYTHSELIRIADVLEMPLAWIMEPDDSMPGHQLAAWLPNYFRLHPTARKIFDSAAEAVLKMAAWSRK